MKVLSCAIIVVACLLLAMEATGFFNGISFQGRAFVLGLAGVGLIPAFLVLRLRL